MLTYQATGPVGGRYLVTYPTPGCCIPTVACDCSTQEQADCEADRLNGVQRAREQAIRREHELCGLFRIRSGEGMR